MIPVIAHGISGQGLIALLLLFCVLGFVGAAVSAAFMTAIWKGTFKSFKGYWRCVAVGALTIGGATIASFVVGPTIPATPEHSYTQYAMSVGMVLAGTALGSWALTCLILGTPVVRGLAASMPVTGLIAIVVLWAAESPASWQRRQEALVDLDCSTSISNLRFAIRRYCEQFHAYPPDLAMLAKSGILKNTAASGAETVRCPGGRKERPFTHFYLAGSDGQAEDALVLCEYRENHPGFRRVLRRNGNVDWLSEPEFQAELAKSVNAPFAAALVAVEGR